MPFVYEIAETGFLLDESHVWRISSVGEYSKYKSNEHHPTH